MRRIALTLTTALAAVSVCAASAHAQRINMPVGYRLTWIGAKWTVGARVVDAAGRPMAAPVSYRVSDPAIATVNARGEVVARKPGQTKVWAVAGKDSASALLIVDQWPARFTFSPNTIRLDALGGKQSLKVLASDSAGIPIVGGTSRLGTCRLVNERVATLTAGDVVAVGNGSTWLRCSDRGLVDSIRVDVQQRPMSVTIANKALLQRRSLAPGDTFSVKVSARDRNQKDIVDAKPTWASLTPNVFTIDPVSGRARTLGGGHGTALIQLGDLSDSVSVDVSGPAYAPVTVEKADTTATKAKGSINIAGVSTTEGEIVALSGTVIDTSGDPVKLSQLRMSIADTSVAVMLDSARIQAKKSGVTALLVNYHSLKDSVTIFVRSKQSTVSGGGDSSVVAPVGAFSIYTIPDSTRSVYDTARTNTLNRIHDNPLISAQRKNLQLTGMAMGAFAEHLTHSETGPVEDRSGPLYGGAATLSLFDKLELSGAFRTGSLSPVVSATTVTSDPLTLTEAEGSLGIFPVQAIGVRLGALLRGENNSISTQHWMIPKVSLVTRFNLIGDVFNTFTAFSLLPKASYSGITGETGSLFSRGGEAGIEFKTSRFSGGVTYATEQLSFDTSTRTESFSSIKIRLGLQAGR